MTLFQKIIKYLAIALAVCLIISIVSGILGLLGVFGLFGSTDAVAEDMTQYPVSGEVTAIKIEIHAADLTVVESESFFVESNLKKLTVSQDRGILTIREKDRLARNYKGAVLKIGIPKGFVFTSAQLETGAGKVDIAALQAEDLSLELGAGEVKIAYLSATKRAELEGGAGKITISDGSLQDLHMEMGAGQLNLTAALFGSSELDLDVGETNLTLLGAQEDYTVCIDNGIGSATVNGQKMKNDDTYGSGKNRVELDGGVGNICVNIKLP